MLLCVGCFVLFFKHLVFDILYSSQIYGLNLATIYFFPHFLFLSHSSTVYLFFPVLL